MSKEEYTAYWKCRVCGAKSPEDAKLCRHCGADLLLHADLVSSKPTPPPPPPPPPEPPIEEEEEEEKKGIKGWMIGLAAALVIALVAVALLPLLGDSPDDSRLDKPEAPTTEQTATEPPATEYLRAWEDNVLMSDEVERIRYIGDQAPAVFGQNIGRDMIATITFLDSVESAPISAWDLSAKQDGSVLGWVVSSGELFDLYIAGDGGVCAPGNCSKLFYYYRHVTQINFNNCFHTDQATSMNSMFSRCEELTELDLSGFVTSCVTDMSDMFCWAHRLTDLDISGFDTSNVTDMSGMFSCANLNTLDLSHFDTSKVTDMNCMFSHCRHLKTLDISNFNTANVTDMGSMFYTCDSLRSLDISSFDTSNVTDMGSMFYGMDHITLDVSHFNTSKVTRMNYMFDDVGYGGLIVIGWENFDTSNVTEYKNFFNSCWGDSWKQYFH